MNVFMAIENPQVKNASKHWLSRLSFFEYLFVLFLLLALVGISPFSIRDANKIAQVADGSGDATRQVLYSVMGAAIFIYKVVNRGAFSFFRIPWPFFLALGWFFVSISWSIAPDISFRRCILTSLVCFMVFSFAEELGPQRMLSILLIFLTVLLVANFASVFLVMEAVHHKDEMAADLAGNWRGLHYHKNIAGPIAGLSAIMFLVRSMRSGTFFNWLMLGLCLCFVYFTRSKTAIDILAVLLPLTALAEYCARRPERIKRFVTWSWVVFTILFFVVMIEFNAIISLVSDADALTGRGIIWSIVWNYASRYPFTGSGFAAFWGIGNDSPVLTATSVTWLYIVAHSHNGFLEILVTTGVFGLAFAVLATFIWPLWRLLRKPPQDFAVLLGLLLFSIFLNLSETRIFQTTREEWIIHLIAIAVIWQSTISLKSNNVERTET
jgi:exopolysaccharide production protein ExoQ